MPGSIPLMCSVYIDVQSKLSSYVLPLAKIYKIDPGYWIRFLW